MSHENLSAEIDPNARRDMILADLQRTSDVTTVSKGTKQLVSLGVDKFSHTISPEQRVDQDLEVIINAGGELFAVVKASAQVEIEGDNVALSDYLLTRLATGGGETRASIVGFLSEKPMQVGVRKLSELGMPDIDDRIAKEHFSVAVVDGELRVIANATNTHETQIITPRAPEYEEVAVGGLQRTIQHNDEQERAEGVVETPAWDPDNFALWSIPSAAARMYLEAGGMRNQSRWPYTVNGAILGNIYNGRGVIRRDSRIDGGVMVHLDSRGNPVAEAVEIDFEKDKIYARWLEEVKHIATKGGAQQMTGKQAMDAAYEVVRKRMQYSQANAEEVIAFRTGGSTKRSDYAGKTVPLADFMFAGVGVCRHQAATVAVMMEKLIDEGLIAGEISLDANTNWNATGEEIIDGHAWARYKDADGTVYIIDVVSEVHGQLVDTDGDDFWNYARAEDRALLLTHRARVRAKRELVSA